MKKIKTFDAYINESITALESAQLKTILTQWQREKFSSTGENDPYLTFEIGMYDGLIEFGYSGHEDSDNTEVKLSFAKDKIEASISVESYSGEGGEYNNKYDKNFDNIDELIDFLKSEIID